jgi:hypothetical protein
MISTIVTLLGIVKALAWCGVRSPAIRSLGALKEAYERAAWRFSRRNLTAKFVVAGDLPVMAVPIGDPEMAATIAMARQGSPQISQSHANPRLAERCGEVRGQGQGGRANSSA